MSGPVEERDRRCDNEALEGLELREGRRTSVGGLDVMRVLPTKGRRTVGAWCFVDLMGPSDAEQPDPLEVGPHPHSDRFGEVTSTIARIDAPRPPWMSQADD